jgi:hypothetical protein
MPLLIVMVLVALGAQVIAWIYAMLTPFADDLRQIQNYNIAYYGAIAGVERSYLVLRWHTAGFEGSWWWMWNNDYGPGSDHDSSIVQKKYFSLLYRRSAWNWMFWQIKNLNTAWVVPTPWEWDLDPDVSSGQNYYRLTFDESLQYALYVDKSPVDDYYTGYGLSHIKNLTFYPSLKVSIRVPIKLADLFDNGYQDGTYPSSSSHVLDKNDNVDLDDDWVTNDIIVNRTLFWYTWDTEFTIFPSINVNNDNTVASNDTAIREDVINAYSDSNKFNISYDTDSKDTNPNAVWDHTANVDKFNQSPEDAVKTGFNVVLRDNVANDAASYSNTYPINRMNLKFSLVNLLKYEDDKVYPYLEIQLKDWNTSNAIPDTYFHILWEWKAWAYDVRIKLKKRVFNVSAASDFNVIREIC